MKTPLLALLVFASAAIAQPMRTSIDAPVRAQVVIELDEIDVPRVRASSRSDVCYALGFLHGRERFFQMDVARRMASGRVSELAGSATVELDAQARIWNFPAVADAMMERITDEERALLEMYASGVNAGLASRAARPPEYMMLMASPEAWTARDSVLSIFVLVDQLSHHGWDERWNAAARATLGDEVFDFLHPRGGRLDAPVTGDPFEPGPIPGPGVLDLREALRGWPAADDDQQSNAVPEARDHSFVTRGSNNWAVAAGRSASGVAILATDPHLGLQLPNVWYRAHILWEHEGEAHTAVGVTLPGFPDVVMGSNTHLAWGMTNVHGDFEDQVIVPDGYDFIERTEEIKVRGETEPEVRTFRDTRWGPVTGTDGQGRVLASRWTGAMPEANTLNLFGLIEAKTLEEGLDIAAAWKSAPQNVVIASADGRVGWTMSGYLPKRIGFDGTQPTLWKEGEVGWDGELPMSARPRVIRGGDGYVFTANNRVGSLEGTRAIGRWFPDGARAQRIDEVLGGLETIDEAGMLALQLDTRTRRHDAWRDLVLDVIPRDTDDEALRRARATLLRWSGRADIDDTAHAFVRTLEGGITRRVLEPFQALVLRTDSGTRRASRYGPDVALRLLEARPAHLLSPRFESWDALVLDTVRELVARADRMHPAGTRAKWGDVNVAQIQHPIAQIVGGMMPGLKAPADALAGDWDAVRVAGATFGASVRIVVAPGREEAGILHMPGGQAGAPGDPDFLSGHEAWVEGRPTPLLPGEAVEVLVLEPAPGDR